VKKGVIIAIVLMAALVLPTIGIVCAESTISNMAYPIQTAKTWDGKWSTATEWVDAMPSNFGSNAAFREGYEFISGDAFVVLQDIMIETWDNTNDAGDFYQIGVDAAFPSTDTTPKATQYMINVTGHGSSAVLTWFKGDGTNWVTTAAPTTYKFAENSTTSPTTAATHYCLELQFDKTTLTQPEIGLYIAYYDAHAGGYGLQAWPSTTTKNAAAGWGDIPYSMDPIPEGFNVGIILALTSVAVIAGAIIIKRAPLSKFVTA
jgi:hypothetical protein